MSHRTWTVASAVALVLAVATPVLGQEVASLQGTGRQAYRPLLDYSANLLVQEAFLDVALRQLSTSSGVVIAFSPSKLPAEHLVSCRCEEATVGTALERLLANTPLLYRELKGEVAVMPAAVEPRLPELLPLPRMAMRLDGNGPPAVMPIGDLQEPVVAGVVVNGGNLQPIAGAQVVVEGTQRGTLTDSRGQFRITGLTGSRVTLRVAMLGYRDATQAVSTGDRDIRIELQPSAISLDELVVTGTAGEQTKRSLGNAVAQIDAGPIAELAAVADVSQMLTARVPGVTLRQAQGIAGAGSRVRIRGRSSMQFVGNPLIYVDGVRVNNSFSTGPSTGASGGDVISRMDDINPDEIERIEVIKGPAAATLYGTEASAGVIQIITKRGHEGRPRVHLRLRQGASWFPNEAKTMGTTMWRDPTTGEVLTWNAVDQMHEVGFDYLRRGRLQGYGADVSGGGDNLTYYTAVNYDRDQGVLPGNLSRKFSGRMNLGFHPAQTLNVNTSLSIARGRIDTFDGNYLLSGYYGLPQQKESNTLGFLFGRPDVRDATEDLYQDFDHVTGGLRIEHQPTDFFTQRLEVGLDLTHEKNTIVVPFVPDEFADFFSATNRLGYKNIFEGDATYTTLDYGATLKLPVTEKLTSSTSGGFQYYRRLSTGSSLSGSQFPAPGLTTIAGISGPRQVSEDFVEATTVGLYVQEQLSWEDRLFLTGALRADDNSAFGANFDLVTYPKVSASWVLSEEPFFDFGFVNQFRLRAAYGESGQQPAAFAAIRTYQPITGGDGKPAATPTYVGNPNLGPERGKEIEMGFDAGLFDDRLGLDFTYYNQRTTDAIVPRNVAGSTGFPSSQVVNGGEVKNTGMELQLRGTPIRSDNVTWDLTLNLTTNANEVVALNLPNVPYIPVGWIPNRDTPGYPVNSYWGTRILSADLDADGNPVNVVCDDGSGNGVSCSQAPAVFLGQAAPKQEGSLSTTLTLFDRLRLHGSFDFRLGGHYFNVDGALKCAIYRVHEIDVYPERFDPVDVAACGVQAGLFTDRFVMANDYGKLRELSASYTLPQTLVDQFGGSRATVTVAARNLWVLQKSNPFQVQDPEAFTPVNYGLANQNQAVLPLPFTLVTTINLTF